MTTNTNNPAGKCASVNGINLYYEIHGTGKPLIMLHGGFGTFEMFAALSPALTLDHQVIGVDLYGHGRTALTDRPIRFEQMADDIAGLIGHLGLEKADLLGFSLGGAVALQTAIRHPERVNTLVVISTPFKHKSKASDRSGEVCGQHTRGDLHTLQTDWLASRNANRHDNHRP